MLTFIAMHAMIVDAPPLAEAVSDDPDDDMKMMMIFLLLLMPFVAVTNGSTAAYSLLIVANS